LEKNGVIHVIRESHETPPEVSNILRIAGGLNRFGEPNYRAVWGWNRLDWIGGKWEDRNQDGELVREVIEVRHVPKYTPHDRWHIERWMPPESYCGGSPALWDMQTMENVDGLRVPALGPFPYRGDYELAFTLEGFKGEFIQLTPHIARVFAYSLEHSREAKKESLTERKSNAVDKHDREYDSFADSVLSDAGPAFGGAPNVSVL
jgi:hypothetical protein